MKVVDDVHGLIGNFGDYSLIWFPHAVVDKLKFCDSFFAESLEEPQQSFAGSLLPGPHEALAIGIDRVGQNQIFVSFLSADFVNTDRLYIPQVSLGQPSGNCHFDREKKCHPHQRNEFKAAKWHNILAGTTLPASRAYWPPPLPGTHFNVECSVLILGVLLQRAEPYTKPLCNCTDSGIHMNCIQFFPSLPMDFQVNSP